MSHPAQVPADPCRPRTGRRRRADQRADHDQHADRGRQGDHRADPRCAEAGADIVRVSCPTRPRPARCARSCARPGADRRRHPLPLPPRDRGGRGGRGLPAHQPRQHRLKERVREVVKAARDHGCSMRIGVNAGSLEKHLLEKYGEPCPEAMVESALGTSASSGQRLPRVQDQREGVRRVPRRRRLPAARRGLRPTR
jgi:hypothetical protein